MSGFRITGPGEYRMRNGEKATVYKETGDACYAWVGVCSGINGETWTENGRVLPDCDEALDIVAPWIEPFTITQPGEYVTRSGRKVVVLTVDAPSPRAPIIGHLIMGGDLVCGMWGVDGLLVATVGSQVKRKKGDNAQYPGDIVGKWVIPVSWKAWFPISNDGQIGRPFETKQDASRYRSDKQCVRCIRFDGTKIIDVTDEVGS